MVMPGDMIALWNSAPVHNSSSCNSNNISSIIDENTVCLVIAKLGVDLFVIHAGGVGWIHECMNDRIVAQGEIHDLPR
jgi:hypothetical protein